MKLRQYIIYILRKDNDFDVRHITPQQAKTIRNFKHRGHLYHFDSEYSFLEHDVFSVWRWLTPAKLQKLNRLLIYREPEDPLHGIEIPIEPLRVPTKVNFIEESPQILKGVTRSNVLSRYRAKQKFGFSFRANWWIFVVLGIFIIVALLIFTKTITIPGVNAP